MTLSADKARVVEIYQNGDKKLRKKLEELFGAQQFKQNEIPQSIRERFEQECKEQGLNPKDLIRETEGLSEALATEIAVSNAHTMLRILAKAKRGDWEPDFTNSNQPKYYVWFEYRAGVGFVVHVTGYDLPVTTTYVGSRLCFPTRDMASEFYNENIELCRIILQN